MKFKITLLFLLCFSTLTIGQSLDQDVPYTSNNGGFVFTSPSFELGQTFTAGITDNIVQINVWVYMNDDIMMGSCNGATNTVRLKIYSGEGNGGTVSGYSDNVEVGVQSCSETLFLFSTPIPIISGNMYTMIFEEVVNNCSQVVACMSDGGNPYSNGRPWHQTAGFYEDRDVFLRTYVDGTLTVDDNLNKGMIKMYPNPVTGSKLSIQLAENDNDNVTYRIISILGRVIAKGHLTNNSIQVDNLQSGIYALEINDGEKVMIRKFIKK